MEVTGPVEKVDNLGHPSALRGLSPIYPRASLRFSPACESWGAPLSPLQSLKVSLIHSGRNRGSDAVVPALSTTGFSCNPGFRPG